MYVLVTRSDPGSEQGQTLDFSALDKGEKLVCFELEVHDSEFIVGVAVLFFEETQGKHAGADTEETAPGVGEDAAVRVRLQPGIREVKVSKPVVPLRAGMCEQHCHFILR